MNRVLLFGSTGNLGKKIAEELIRKRYAVTAIVRNENKATEIKSIVPQTVIADVTNPASLKGITNGYEIVISALGKSVSPNDRSKPSFSDVDLDENSFVLDEASKRREKICLRFGTARRALSPS